MCLLINKVEAALAISRTTLYVRWYTSAIPYPKGHAHMSTGTPDDYKRQRRHAKGPILGQTYVAAVRQKGQMLEGQKYVAAMFLADFPIPDTSV
ncbi:hypothetical protein R6Q59_022956 [Mikania micrantha]